MILKSVRNNMSEYYKSNMYTSLFNGSNDGYHYYSYALKPEQYQPSSEPDITRYPNYENFSLIYHQVQIILVEMENDNILCADMKYLKQIILMKMEKKEVKWNPPSFSDDITFIKKLNETCGKDYDDLILFIQELTKKYEKILSDKNMAETQEQIDDLLKLIKCKT